MSTLLILGSIIILTTLWFFFSQPETTTDPTQTVVRNYVTDGYHNFASGKTQASFNNLCLTDKPYGNVSDVYWWWKYIPFYWQRQYESCSEYGCGGSHDKSSCPQKFNARGLDCASVNFAKYQEKSSSGAKDKLFYHNRAAFCAKNPSHINCPNSFPSRLTGVGNCPTSSEPFSTTTV